MIRVVVVEDEEPLRRELVYTTPWRELGCCVIGEAADGRSGLELICRANPDIVLADIRMPGMSGIAMVEAARNRLGTTVLPAVVFLTGYGEFDYARRALRLGVADYLLKPVDDAELRRTLERVGSGLPGAAGTAGPPEPPPAPALPEVPDPGTLVTAAVDYLAHHYGERVGVAETARRLGVSASYLSRRFSAETGYTVTHYLTCLRISAAVEMLRRSRASVKEVMYGCGYRDASYFGRVFRRLMGLSPSEYRRRCRVPATGAGTGSR